MALSRIKYSSRPWGLLRLQSAWPCTHRETQKGTRQRERQEQGRGSEREREKELERGTAEEREGERDREPQRPRERARGREEGTETGTRNAMEPERLGHRGERYKCSSGGQRHGGNEGQSGREAARAERQ